MNLILGLCLLLGPLSLSAQTWRPISKTCADYGDSQSALFLGMPVEQFEKLSDEDGIAHLRKVFAINDFYETFLVLISPSPILAEKVLRLNMERLIEINCTERAADDSLVTILTSLKSCLKKKFSSIKVAKTSWGDHTEMLHSDGSAVGAANEAAQSICSQIHIEPSKCRPSILPFLSIINPAMGSPSVTYPQEFFRISTDPALVKLSAEFTFYFIDILISASQRGKPSGKDLFTDLVTFFQQKGYKRSAAKELAFTFLGVYGARGASFVMKSDYYSGNNNTFGNKYGLHPASHSAMSILSVGLSYLDKLAFAAGKSYAIPSAFSTNCHMGKPYHFWMAAALARYAKKQGFSNFVSYYGPVIAGIGYDFKADANGRDIAKLFRIKTPYDSYANMTRIDNWARAMGAHFGRHAGTILPVNANHLLEEMFENAEMPLKDPGEDQAARLREYNRIVRPIPLILKLSL